MTEFYTDQLSQFAGWRVVAAVSSPPDDFGDEYFGLELKNGPHIRIVWFLRDDEGNGPGSFEIQEIKEGTR